MAGLEPLPSWAVCFTTETALPPAGVDFLSPTVAFRVFGRSTNSTLIGRILSQADTLLSCLRNSGIRLPLHERCCDNGPLRGLKPEFDRK
jgi:hypothetical protein